MSSTLPPRFVAVRHDPDQDLWQVYDRLERRVTDDGSDLDMMAAAGRAEQLSGQPDLAAAWDDAPPTAGPLGLYGPLGCR